MLFQMAMELWEEYHAGAVAEFVISYQLQSEKEGFLKIHGSGPKCYHSIAVPGLLSWHGQNPGLTADPVVAFLR
jgi:hypothetical protein